MAIDLRLRLCTVLSIVPFCCACCWALNVSVYSAIHRLSSSTPTLSLPSPASQTTKGISVVERHQHSAYLQQYVCFGGSTRHSANRVRLSAQTAPPPTSTSLASSTSASSDDMAGSYTEDRPTTPRDMVRCSDRAVRTFQGTSVLLTGATGGLGKELAMQLLLCEPKHLVLSGRSKQNLEKTKVDLLKSLGTAVETEIHCAVCDLSDPADVDRMGREAVQLCGGTVDVLVNNGGVSSRSNFVDTDIDVDRQVMQVNFLSGAALAKIVVPGMLVDKKATGEENGSTRGGKIIWVSSVQGKLGIPSRTSYAASKFAVQGYCESMRAELASSGVTVHVASPGYIRTNLSVNAVTGDGSSWGKLDDTTANGADPKDVAVDILERVAKGQADFVVAATGSSIVAIWLRLLFPGILRKLLDQRFAKSEASKQKAKQS